MTKKLTMNGINNLSRKISELESNLSNIVEEKGVAYNSTGDTWHDNPYFNELERKEQSLRKQIMEYKKIIETAEIIKPSEDDTKVKIGSILSCKYDISGTAKNMIIEIVGHGETNPAEGKISYESAVGKGLLGAKEGDNVEIITPKGKIIYKVEKLFRTREEADGIDKN